MNDREIYFSHLTSITGNPKPEVHRVGARDEPSDNVTILVYRDWPTVEMTSAFTFGLSHATHPDWKHGRAELTISMESNNDSWPEAIGRMVSELRGRCPFTFGETINYGKPISTESAMSAFLVFAPIHLTKREAQVRLKEYNCIIKAVYPLFEEELGLLERLGLEAFWKQPGWDITSPHREILRGVH
jgi:hypothetical protein